jgi:hypothetical protein
VQFSRVSYTERLIPFRLENLNTLQDPAVGRRFRLRQLYFNLMRFSQLFWYIYYFGFKYFRPVLWELGKTYPDRSLLERLGGLNREKLRGMFK